MARIAEDEIRRLKETVDLVALVRASGVELAPVGKDMRGLCPFHEETTASFSVSPDVNLYHCFGCNAAGSPIDFVMATQHVSFRNAVEVLRSANGSSVAPVVDGKRRATPLQAAPRMTLDADDQRLLNDVANYYHETLKASPEAQAYLEHRGLRSSELVAHFRVGFANRTLGYHLPRGTWKAGQELRARLASLGILRESGHEHFSGCVVFPILDEAGNVVSMYGRKITPRLREGTPLHVNLSGPLRGVWNLQAFAASREIVLCEAVLDAAAFWCAGYRGVTAALGVNGLTDDHWRAFRKHGTEKVYVAFDRDDAGDRAADELAPRLAEAGMDVYRVQFPRNMDANEYARKVTPASESLGVAIRSAVFVAKGKRTTSPVPPAHEDADPSPVPLHDRTVDPPVDAAQEEPHEEPTVAVGADVAAVKSTEAAEPVAAAPADCTACAVDEPPTAEPVAAPDGSFSAHGDEVSYVVGDRSYRVRGIARNNSPDQLRVSLRVARGEKVYLDGLDMVSARSRELYVRQAALELAVDARVVKRDVGRILLELEVIQERRIAKVLEPKPKGVQIPEDEKQEAFTLLRDPRLLDRIVEDLDRVGLIGETTNKLTAYLAATSRKLDQPLAVLIQSNSAAGKSAVMDAVLELMPEEDVERYSCLTGQSLYYLPDADLRHRVLALSEMEGAERASYPLKLLQSEGRISIAVTVKDPETGEMRTKRHEVHGPVTVFATTTAPEVDEELQNRALVLTVDEDRGQTRAIHAAQRRSQTLEGVLARRDREAVVRLHRNAQRLLRPLLVVNPYADGLTFLDTRLRARRDHMKYLTLIKAVALLRQYQRSIRQAEHRGETVPYIEVTIQDVEIANRLANEVLGRSLDELAPQTRRLLLLLDRMVSERCAERKVAREDYRFTRREVREWTQWTEKTVRKHLDRLVEMEYVVTHRGGRGLTCVHELVYDGKGQDGGRFVVGLIDPAKLRGAGTTPTSTTPEGSFDPPSTPLRPHFGRGSTSGGNGSGARDGPHSPEIGESVAEKCTKEPSVPASS